VLDALAVRDATAEPPGPFHYPMARNFEFIKVKHQKWLDEVEQDLRGDHAADRVLSALMRRVSWWGEVKITTETLAGALGYASPDTVRKAIKRLEALGWVYRVAGKKKKLLVFPGLVTTGDVEHESELFAAWNREASRRSDELRRKEAETRRLRAEDRKAEQQRRDYMKAI